MPAATDATGLRRTSRRAVATGRARAEHGVFVKVHRPARIPPQFDASTIRNSTNVSHHRIHLLQYPVPLPFAAPQLPALSSFFGPLQLLGYLACAISLSAFFARTHRRFLLTGATSAFLWALHYHLLGERIAAALSAVSAGRNTIALHVLTLPRRKRIALTLAACSLLVTLAAFTWSGPLTALPTFASCLTMTAAFWLAGYRFRRVLLVSDSCWLVFGVLVGSIAGALAATISLSINAWTLHRLREAERNAAPPATPA